MKQLKSTGILVLLVAAIASYAYFVEYRGKIDKETQEKEAKKIVPFSLEEISEFTVTTPLTEYVFKKVTEEKKLDQAKVPNLVKKWHIEKPFQDVANYGAVQGYLSQFGAEVYEDVAAEGPSIDFSIYGLNEKTSSISFKKADGSEVTTVEVGTVAALGGKKYIRVNKQDKVLIAGYFWESQFQKGVTELREKNLVPPDFDFARIEIKTRTLTGVEHLKFDKVSGKWEIKDLVTNDTDQKIVDDIYYQIKNIRASQILKDTKNPSDLKSFGLDEPDIKVVVMKEIMLGKSPEVEILFSKNMTGQVYAVSSDRNVIFSLNPPSVLPLKRIKDDYRDKKTPLVFDLAEIKRLEYRSDLASFKLVKEDNTWKSVDKIEGKVIDNVKVIDILSKLSAMKVKKYFDQGVDFQKSGMIELKLFAGNGNEVLDLKWSPKPVDDVFVGTSSLSDKTFGLSMQDVGSLPFQTVVVDPPKTVEPGDKDGMHIPTLPGAAQNKQEKKIK